MFTLTVLTLGIAMISSASTLTVPRSNFLSKNKLNYTCMKMGNFSHPTARTQYIYCDQKLTPSTRNCPTCKTDPVCCPDARLIFNAGTGICGWADKACGLLASTTTTSAPTPARPANTRTPVPGSECGFNCMQIGDCSCYFTCNPVETRLNGDDGDYSRWDSTTGMNSDTGSIGTGRWEKLMCDDGDFWNPNVGPHGGTCDFWENLSPAIQEKYQNDTLCPTPPPRCAWRANVICANKYFYLPENSKNIMDELKVSCPVSKGEHRYWDQQTKRCRKTCSTPPCKICIGLDQDNFIARIERQIFQTQSVTTDLMCYILLWKC